MTNGRATMVGLMHSYLSWELNPFVTLLDLHKLMNFLLILGEPLRLSFT